MRLPVVDIIEVGAGGGSMAWIDDGGSLKVGPRSTGSTPGPACYGRGGKEPTVTDANLVTGRLNPHRFLGGEFDLDLKLATRAIEQRIAKPLGLSVMDAALGILRIADVKMSFAVRAITMERGYDPRKFAMVVFGGGGPMHGMAIAREIHVPRVIVPPQPGHFSALGMLMTDLRQDFVQTKILDYASLTPSVLEILFKGLEQQAMKSLQAEGHALDSIVLHRSLDMRYLGQEYTVRVPVPSHMSNAASLQALRLHFDELYESRYGHAALDQSGELVNLRLTALGHVVKPSFASLQDKRTPAAVTQRHRPVVFQGVGQVNCPVVQRAELKAGQVIVGPAVIEEYASTTILHPGDSAVFHVDGFLVITLPTGASHEE
jgi:N-methylhydantoinase A